MNKPSFDFRSALKPGTWLCSAIYAAIAVVIAVLLLTIGLWRTLFIFAFGAVGAVLGRVGDKKAAVRDVVNRRFPAKDEPIKDAELERSDVAEISEKIEQSVYASHTDDQE